MKIVEYQRESVQLCLIDSIREWTLSTHGEDRTGRLRVSHLHACWVRRGQACQMEVNFAGRRIEAEGVLAEGMQLWCQGSELPKWIADLLAPSTPPWWPR